MHNSSNVKLLNSVLDPDLKNASQKGMVDLDCVSKMAVIRTWKGFLNLPLGFVAQSFFQGDIRDGILVVGCLQVATNLSKY